MGRSKAGFCHDGRVEQGKVGTLRTARSGTMPCLETQHREHSHGRIADRLRDGEKSIAEAVGEATVLFSDLSGFTQLTKRLSPSHLVEILSDIFTALDGIADEKGVEKVKTIGDNYMVVGGVRNPSSRSAEAVAEFAIEAMNAIDNYALEHDLPLKIRVGMATGSVVSGVIGTKVPIFDLWGETVNLASRLESHGIESAIQVSESTYWRLHRDYEFENRGEIELKGGLTENAYLLTGRKLVAPAFDRQRPERRHPRDVLKSVK